MNRKDVLVIIPAFNEEENIVATVQQVVESGYDYIVVNDCSTDHTAQLCKAHQIRFLDLPINLGIGGAMQTGYRYACVHDYAYAVQVDGDGQHNPESIDRLYKTMTEKKVDMVIGSRFIEHEGFQSSALRQQGIRYFSRLIRRMTGQTITDPTSGLRMVNRTVMKAFSENYPKDYPEPESTTALLHEGLRVVEVPVVMRARQGGTSSIKPLKAVYYMVKVSIAVVIAGLGGRRA